MNQITVYHCLNHQGGWDRNIANDPLGQTQPISEALGLDHPAGRVEHLQFLFGQPLQLKVDSVSLANQGSAVRLTFLAASNNTYTVEWRPAADTGTWTRLADVVATSSNRVVEILDPAAPGAKAQRYYRLATPRLP